MPPALAGVDNDEVIVVCRAGTPITKKDSHG
jgi:hypothetical protein